MKKQIPCMVVTDDQYTNDLREPLLAMRMVENYVTDFENYPLLVINVDGILGKITNLPIECSNDNNRCLIEPYNKEQFLAECRKVLGLKEESETTEETIVKESEVIKPTQMKYKVGDQVKIKSLDWYNENKDTYGCIYNEDNDIYFSKEMSEYCGFVATIINISNNYYDIDIDCAEYLWNDFMFEENTEEVVVPEVAKDDSEKSEYPKVMLVSNTKADWIERIVIGKQFGKFIVAFKYRTLERYKRAVEYPQNVIKVIIYDYAKEIPETINLTKQQIAEKFGVDPNYLNIVE